MALTQKYKLDMTPGSIPPVVHLSQYDKTERVLEFELYAQSEPYEVPSGALVQIMGTKPDHTGFSYACLATRSVVTAQVHDQMTVCAGRYPGEIRVSQGGKIISSANFSIDVERAALADDTQISKTELPRIEKAAEAYDDALISKNAAAQSARSAKSSADAAQAAQRTAAGNASASAANAKAAASSASQANSAAVSAKGSADRSTISETASKISQAAAAASESNAAKSAKAAAESAKTATSIAGVGEFSFYLKQDEPDQGLHMRYKQGGLS